MSDRDALLAAVRANPNDDAPRLAFADWLDANAPDAAPKKGGTPSAWATLIRTECELARLRNDGSATAAVYDHCDQRLFETVRWERAMPEMARLAELTKRVSQFRRASLRVRRVGLPAGKGLIWPKAGDYDETDRGFPGGATIRNWGMFVSALPELAESSPAMALRFADNVAPDAGKRAVKRGFAKWCRRLDLDVLNDEAAELIEAMSDVPETAGVRSLYLTNMSEEPAARALAALADSPNWSGLRELGLEACSDELPAPLVRRLFRAPHLRGLERVSLQGETTVPAAEAVTQLPALRELGFDFSNCDDRTAKIVAASPSLTGLRTLRVSCGDLTGSGLAALLTAPALRNLAVLSLYICDLRKMPTKGLASVSADNLRVVSLGRCQTEGTAAAVARCLPNVVCFNAGVQLDAANVREVLAAFGNRPPAVLALHGAKLDLADVKALAAWPGAAALDELDIWHVPLKNNTAKALAQSPHLRNLRHLHYTPATAAADAIIKAAFGDRAQYGVLY